MAHNNFSPPLHLTQSQHSKRFVRILVQGQSLQQDPTSQAKLLSAVETASPPIDLNLQGKGTVMLSNAHIVVQIDHNNDADNALEYKLIVKHEAYDGKVSSWEIERSFSQFEELRTKLLSKDHSLEPCQFLTEKLLNDAKQLEASLNFLLEEIGEQTWNHPCLISFLDNCSEQSFIVNLQVKFLTDQVQRLSSDLSAQMDRVQSMQTNHYFLFGIVQDMLAGTGSDPILKKRLHHGRSSQDLLKSMFQQVNNGGNSSSLTDAETDENSNRSSILSLEAPEAHLNVSKNGPDTLSTNPVINTSFSHSTDYSDAVPTGSRSQSFYLKNSMSPMPPHAVDNQLELLLLGENTIERSEGPDQSGPARPVALTRPTSDEYTSSSISGGSVPSTPHFPAELHPNEAMCGYYSTAVEQILQAVRPNNAQMQYRASVIAMLKKHVRLCLNSNAFATGLHDILCSLPDDPISVSVILSKNLLANWHVCLVDRLNLVNERLATSGNIEMVFPEEEELLMYLPDDYSSPMRHEITHMTHSKLNMNFSINVNVDNSCEVEILANNRHDLCMLAFVEEMATLVGKGELFKRSLLLIRAWWHYETAAYVGTPIKHYLKDSNVCIMVCAIFNQYHGRISSPLQALCLFLAEYSAYDGATQAITLQGIVPFKSPTSSQPMLLDAQPSHLISCEVIEKYWNLFNMSSASAESSDYESIIRTCSSDDCFPDESGNITTTSGVTAASTVVMTADHDRSAPGGIEKINMKNLSSHNLHYFERQLFSVVHPFNHTNMVVEKLSSRRQMRLHKAFQIGAAEMTVYLRQSTDNINNSGDILNYFPNVLARFGDAFAARAAQSNADTADTLVVDAQHFSSTEKLWANIMYCNLMLESVLSEPALLTLSTEILAVKGPLPVGEIGKLLAETTSINSLSQKLKERFGGLKKFLERFQSAFVISNDHPFNPNVLLRSSLSTEHLDLIDRGIFPHQLLQKTKKAAAPAKKKKTPGSEFGTSGNLVSSSGSPASNQGSPFLGVQAHKFMGSPSLALTGHRDGGMKFINSNNNNMNKSQASPAQQQQKMQRVPSFTNSPFAPAVVLQQQQQQQMGMHGGGGGAYGNYQQQKASPTHTISPPHTLYAQHPHAHQQYAQQGGGGGYHQSPLSPNNQFTRSFREGDLNQQAGVYGGNNNNNPQQGGSVPVKRHSFQGPSSDGAYYQQSNYYNEILSGGGGSNSNNNNPNAGALEGGGLSTGPIGRRPSHPGSSGGGPGSNSHLLGSHSLRINDLPPSPPKDDQQRLGAGPSSLYALSGDAHGAVNGDSNASYSAFQQYRAPPSLGAPLSYQQHPHAQPQSPHLGGGAHLASPSAQAAQLQGVVGSGGGGGGGAQGLSFQGFSSSEDATSPRGDSFLRDFSKDFSKF